MDLLKRIELKMEQLTQQLERLPPEKVKISQRVSKIYQFHILINLSNRVLSRHYLDRLKNIFSQTFLLKIIFLHLTLLLCQVFNPALSKVFLFPKYLVNALLEF